MAGNERTGFDTAGGKTYYATIARSKGRLVLVDGGILPEGARLKAKGEAHAALWASEALAVALPGVAIEEADEAFRWEVAKSGAISADALRQVQRRGPGTDPGPPFLGIAGDVSACEARAAAVRAAGLTPAAITLDAIAFERLLYATGRLPARGTVLHVDLREGSSVVSAYAGAGLALRRTIRTSPIAAESVAIDLQRSASYAERKLTLPASESVYLSGDALTPEIAEAIARGLPGFQVEIFDPLGAVDVGPGVDVEALRKLGPALALAIGLALLDKPEPDFAPPSERSARTIRVARQRARTYGLIAVPIVLAIAGYVRANGPEAREALIKARAADARVKRLQAKQEEAAELGRTAAAWRELIHELGAREPRASAFLVDLAGKLPPEVYLASLELRPPRSGKPGEPMEVLLKGDVVTVDDSAAIHAKNDLNRIAKEKLRGAVVHDVGRRGRTSFTMDGILPDAGGAKP